MVYYKIETRQKAQPVGYVYPCDYPGNNYYCESGNVGPYEQVYYLTDPFGMAVAVPMVMVVVLKLTYHGSIGNYQCV